MKLCESETASGSHGSSLSTSGSSGQAVANGGRPGSSGGLKLGIVRLGRAAGKVGKYVFTFKRMFLHIKVAVFFDISLTI